MSDVASLDPALTELREAARWYDEQESGVGREFLHAAEQALDRLLHDPSARPTAGRGLYRQLVERLTNVADWTDSAST